VAAAVRSSLERVHFPVLPVVIVVKSIRVTSLMQSGVPWTSQPKPPGTAPGQGALSIGIHLTVLPPVVGTVHSPIANGTTVADSPFVHSAVDVGPRGVRTGFSALYT